MIPSPLMANAAFVGRVAADLNTGWALVLGLCVAFIGLTVDYITTIWSNKRKLELGLA